MWKVEKPPGGSSSGAGPERKLMIESEPSGQLPPALSFIPAAFSKESSARYP
jgi:hypothetical protein